MSAAEKIPWPDDVAFVATVYPDWTVMELPSGDAFAFNRGDGKVYKLPHESCPFLIIRPRWEPTP